MKNVLQHIEELTGSMQEALQNGQMKNFSRMSDQRMSLFKEISTSDFRPQGLDALVRRTEELNREWRTQIHERAAGLKVKISKTMKKRFSLGCLSKAYVGSNNAGNVLFRRG